ncbi:hypothetical protein AB1K70_19165 [Bremerella sp. JC770]|uniref:hypothetical protein n=1 Tax=Bremerella sp. JC770 TaxID=3232137 RepID=UPI003457BD98
MSVVEGQALRDAALDRFSSGPAALTKYRAAAACLFLEEMIERPDEGVSFDEIREMLDEPPEGFKPSAFGSIPRSLSVAGVIKRVGYRPSRIAGNHAHVYPTWQIKDQAAALAKLANLKATLECEASE